MSESTAKDIFLKYKNELIKEFGSDGLTNQDCNFVGKRNFGRHWGGCLPYDKVHVKPNKYYVVNTSSSGQPGTHWLALITINKHAYLWDSYNRAVKRLVPHLIHSLIKHHYKIGPQGLEHPMEQIGTSSQVCGQESLAYLLTVRDIGINNTANI